MSVTKLDLKHTLGDVYLARRKPGFVEIPDLQFLMIDGRGDPSAGEHYGQAIEALYSVAYALKYRLKREASLDYPVMPLEGLWWLGETSDYAAQSRWQWTAMLLQPDVITGELLDDAIEEAAQKRSIPAVASLRLQPLSEGLCAHILHVGPYADVERTIVALDEFIAEAGYTRRGKHHEIYLGDPRRSAPERLRTIIRRPVER